MSNPQSNLKLDGNRVTEASHSSLGVVKITDDINSKNESDVLNVSGVKDQIDALNTKFSNKKGIFVGQIIWHYSRGLEDGYIAADGLVLSRSMFPDLFKLVKENKVPVVTEQEWSSNPAKRGSFTLGDGENTFRIPDYNGKSEGSLGRVFLSGDGFGSDLKGTIQGDAIRNITGKIGAMVHENTKGEGAFKKGSYVAKTASIGDLPNASLSTFYTLFDASGIVPVADENRPRNVSGCYYISYAGGASNSGLVDAVTLAGKVAELENHLKKRTGFYVGQTIWHNNRINIPSGSITADGQLLNRAIYGGLFDLVRDKKVPVIDEAIWLADPSKRGFFTLGDGKDTFRIPDYNGKSAGSLGRVFLSGDGRGSNEVVGSIQGDAIRNITGSIDLRTTRFSETATNKTAMGGKGVFDNILAETGVTTRITGVTESGVPQRDRIYFDASKVVPVAEENQPRNVTGCYIIFFAGEPINLGRVDVFELATEVTKLSNEVNKFNGYHVGDITWSTSRKAIPKGRLPLDGQVLNRQMFPDLFDMIRDGKVPVVDDKDWLLDVTKRGSFTLGDGSTNMRLPDYNGMSEGSGGRVFLSGDGILSDKVNGMIQGDAIRNIKGGFLSVYHKNWFSGGVDGSGPFKGIEKTKDIGAVEGATANLQPSYLEAFYPFDASKVVPTTLNENRPRNVTGVYTIVVAGQSVNEGKMDALYLLQEMQKLRDEMNTRSLGYGQKWVRYTVKGTLADGVTPERDLNIQYVNRTNKPIMVNISVISSSRREAAQLFFVEVDGIMTTSISMVPKDTQIDVRGSMSTIVPPGSTYSLKEESGRSDKYSVQMWSELR